MKLIKSFIIAIGVLSCDFAFSTELNPWFGPMYEFEAEFATKLYGYKNIDGAETIHQPYINQFYQASLLFPFEFPLGMPWSAEVETTLANTRRQHLCFDDLRFTGRYQWLNDIVGDPFTLVTGITLIQAFRHSVDDVASFHHGKAEMEGHVAIGREISCEEYWLSRWWSVLAVGIADKGKPWLRTHSEWEKNWVNNYFAKLFLDSLWGFGKKNIEDLDKFKGYGLINHQSVDIGGGLKYINDSDAILEATYAYRVFAKNFPEHSHQLRLSYTFAFGL